MGLRIAVLVHLSLFLFCVSGATAEHVGTCFLSPFQFPSSSPASQPSNPQAEFRSAFAINQLSPIAGNALTTVFTSRSNAHGNAPQVPPDKIGGDNRIVGQVKETPTNSSQGNEPSKGEHRSNFRRLCLSRRATGPNLIHSATEIHTGS